MMSGSGRNQIAAKRTMQKDIVKSEVKVLGIDLAKQSFQLRGVGDAATPFCARS
jgi:hypothetical protein